MNAANLTKSVCAVAAALVMGSSAAEASRVMNLELVYTGSTPTGSGPWLTATFDDGPALGTVSLTLEANNLASGEFVSNWYFNVGNNSQLTGLGFTEVGRSGSFKAPTLGDANAGNGIDFDFSFNFTTSNSGGGSKRFNLNDSFSVVLFNTASNLTVDSFFTTSVGNFGVPFYSGAHVQGICGDLSGRIGAAPEASTVIAGVLLGGLCIGGDAYRRFRRPAQPKV